MSAHVHEAWCAAAQRPSVEAIAEELACGFVAANPSFGTLRDSDSLRRAIRSGFHAWVGRDVDTLRRHTELFVALLRQSGSGRQAHRELLRLIQQAVVAVLGEHGDGAA